MKRLFIVLLMFLSITTAFAQNITKAEYFFDHDPGVGNGTSISNFSPATIVNFTAGIPISALTPGFHVLLMRAYSDGIWSLTEPRYFYISSNTTINTSNITAAEYFIDADPGVGNGTPTPVGTTGATVNFTAMIPANLSPGFHWLAIRTKDAEGKWGLSDTRTFYLYPPAAPGMPAITAAEYFFDHDPGVGSGAALGITTPGNIITQTFMITVPAGMSPGDHFLTIRVKDQQGNWSLFEKDTLTIGAVASTITCPANVTISAAAGQCSAVVNNIDAVTSPAGASYTYTMNGATIGTGTGTVSGKTFNAGVTTVTYALNSTPSINCSFTVTVNANISPSVSISHSPTIICSAATVTFTASPVNGGSTPTYQWKVNDINVGSNSNTYTISNPVNGNTVKVIMTSSLGCATPPSVTSNSITMVVNDSVQEFVSITASATTICAGTLVTFAAAESGGGSGSFQWKLNGNNVGTNSLIYRTDSLHNGDKVKVVYTPTYACSPPLVSSNEITITVNPTVTPSVSVLASATNICPGQQVTFTATPVNGGATPFYQWKLNGNNVGSNSPTYQNAALQNDDVARVVMTSSLVSVCQPTASSNSITMSVGQQVNTSVNITSTATTICSGQSVTFTATPVNGGNNPVYEWMVNNSVVGSNSNTFTTSSLQNGNVVKVSMVSSMACANPWSSVSNAITMSVGTALTPSVNIQSTAIDICAGQQVTFTATPTNGGNNPSYQWKLNGNNVGTNSATYQSSSLNNADTIRVMMTTSLSCAGSPGAMSNYISMDVTLPVSPSVNIAASAINICQGQTVTFTATPINGGTQPYFEWKINGNNVLGTSSNVYPIPNLQNGDMVTVEMSTSLTCTTVPSAISNAVTINVSQLKTYYADFDKDGYGNGASGVTDACIAPAGYVSNNGDCNDNNASIHPGATEICGNGIDDDCDGQIDEGCASSPDVDGDGYTVAQGDCNDNNQSVHPGATETCGNGIDDDCDGQIDEGCASSPDNDGDGYTVAQGDCNDNNPSVHPGATEICGNGIDDDCDDQTDEGCNVTLPTLTLRTYPIKEGDIGQTILNVEVTLSLPAPLPVTVHYSTSNEDATAGSDYIATSGSLVIPAGATSGSVQVRIIGDLIKESNERFRLNFSDPVNVILNDDAYSRIMIIDDDKGKPNSASPTKDAITEELPFKIPTVTKRNSVWMIPQIGNYENEVMILNVQGQIVSRFINYKNQTPVGNVASGLYFYRIQIKESSGQLKYYTGRLLITE